MTHSIFGGQQARHAAALGATWASFALCVLGLQACGASSSAPPVASKPPGVSVSPAVKRSVTDIEEFSGRLEATDYVELHPRVSGTIVKVHFVDGATVKAGDVLFTIDPLPFEAEVSRLQSLLDSSKARFNLAQLELIRSRSLLASQASSKEEVDQLISSEDTTRADIQGAEAALRIAKLNLGYTAVRSPIDGKVSRANITLGNLVNQQSMLTSIAGVSRMYAYFDGSEQTFLALQESRASGKVPQVQMGLTNEEQFPHMGKLDFVDNRVNPLTGAIRMRATFDNKEGLFTPGLSTRIRMQNLVGYDAVMVPEVAIGTDQTKKYVLVVGADGKAAARDIKPGNLFGQMRVVLSGVKPGENVIVDGLLRVRPGSPVTPEVLKTDESGLPIYPAGAAVKS